MGTRDDRALAALLLTQRLVEGVAAPLSAREFWRLLQVVDDPAVLLDASPEALVATYGLGRDQAERLAQRTAAATAVVLEVERLSQRGVEVVTPFDEAFPARLRGRLGDAAPALLHVAGPSALLGDDGIAVVGSRNVAEADAEVAGLAAKHAVVAGRALISGGARGVDQLAMNAAYAAAGHVVGVLADALDRRLRDAATRRAIGDERVCLVTPYKPSAGFSVANAMGRNKIVYGLARSTLVVAADHGSGGTWEGAKEALRHGFGRVGVWLGEGASPGNAALVELGATPITAVDELLALEPVAPRPSTQLNLGV